MTDFQERNQPTIQHKHQKKSDHKVQLYDHTQIIQPHIGKYDW